MKIGKGAMDIGEQPRQPFHQIGQTELTDPNRYRQGEDKEDGKKEGLPPPAVTQTLAGQIILLYC